MSSTREPGEEEQDNDWFLDTFEEASLGKDMDFPESSFFQASIGRNLPDAPSVDANH